MPKFLLLTTVILMIILTIPGFARGDDLNDLEQQLRNTQQQLQQAESQKQSAQTEIQRLEALKKEFEGTLSGLQNNINLTRDQLNLTLDSIAGKETEIENTQKELVETEQNLVHKQTQLNNVTRNLYIADFTPNWLGTIFNVESSSGLMQILFYQSAIIDDTQTQIKDLNQQIHKISEIRDLLTEIKIQLEEEKNNLLVQEHALNQNINYTQTQVNIAQNQQSDFQQSLLGIEQQIAELNQRQKNILAAKAAAALTSTSVGSIELNPSAIEQDPPKDGQVYFSFWTYGYPHRVGMSQYGALGRSISGQNALNILRAYYSGIEIVDWDGPENIRLADGREINFENDYLMGIGEMPSCWGQPDRGGFEALKAQAIAARTYAIAYTNNGEGTICTDQRCQVYVGASKVNGLCGEYWQQAVTETAGQVITHSGSPITAWYASTTGGFTLSASQVWGGSRPYTQSIKDFAPDGTPYDGPNYGDSPWYHKAWGNQPWLNFDQVTELINAALLPTNHDNQVDSLSAEEIIDVLQSSNIEPVKNLKSLEIIDENGNSGANTAQVAYLRAYYEDGKSAQVTGSRFKFVYNLRSPGTNAIWTTRFDILTAADL